MHRRKRESAGKPDVGGLEEYNTGLSTRQLDDVEGSAADQRRRQHEDQGFERLFERELRRRS